MGRFLRTLLMRNGHADLLVLRCTFFLANLIALSLHQHFALLPDDGIALGRHLFSRDEPEKKSITVPF